MDNGLMECQKEIRRLISVVREQNEQIERLNTLLYNAIDLLRIDTNEQDDLDNWIEYLCNKLGTTKEELKQIGIEI